MESNAIIAGKEIAGFQSGCSMDELQKKQIAIFSTLNTVKTQQF